MRCNRNIRKNQVKYRNTPQIPCQALEFFYFSCCSPPCSPPAVRRVISTYRPPPRRPALQRSP